MWLWQEDEYLQEKETGLFFKNSSQTNQSVNVIVIVWECITICYKSNPLFPSFMIHWGKSWHGELLTLNVGRNTRSQPSWPQTLCRKREGRREKYLRPALSVGSHSADYFHLTGSEGCMPKGLLGEGLPYQSDSWSVPWQNCCWASYISLWNHGLHVTHLH